jgi:hypothetical protein
MECCGEIVRDNGFNVCFNCGRTFGRFLETRLQAYGRASHYFPRGYSRKSRFEKKVLGALRRLSTHKVDAELMEYLRCRSPPIETPQQLLAEIGRYPTQGRRPYIFIMYYWVALGFKQPMVTERDMNMLKREFDHIFFAWERLGFPNPKFPYAYTFKRMVLGETKYSKGMHDLVPFVRTLRCCKRRARYDRLFGICKAFDFKEIHFRKKEMHCETKCAADEKPGRTGGIRYPRTEVYAHEVSERPRMFSPFDCKGVYKTKEDVAVAFADGTFDVAKTMHIAPDGKFYFLSWKNGLGLQKPKPIHLQNMQVQNTQQAQLLATQNLNAMLAAQSMLQ